MYVHMCLFEIAKAIYIHMYGTLLNSYNFELFSVEMFYKYVNL